MVQIWLSQHPDSVESRKQGYDAVTAVQVELYSTLLTIRMLKKPDLHYVLQWTKRLSDRIPAVLRDTSLHRFSGARFCSAASSCAPPTR